jgi:hypothetical protein
MARGEKETPELVRAAEALEDELLGLETLSRSVRKIQLDSQKNIARAVKELNEALALPERIADGLRALAVAMQHMEARQQTAIESLAPRAEEIQARVTRLGEHMQAFGELGKAAGEITVMLQSNGERAAVIEHVEARLAEIDERARALFESARKDDFPEVAREADALKQRLGALRGKLLGKS